jgi:hypothetical protein
MFRKQPVVETGTQEPAKTASTVKWTGGSLLGGKAISVLVWGALLCAPISLFVAHGAQVAVDRVKATPISQGATTVPALQQSAGSFALGYVGAWLSATQNDSTALDAYLSATPAGLTATAFQYRNMAIASIVPDQKTNLVTVVIAADVEQTKLDANGQTSTWPRRYFQVVVQTTGSKLTAATLPAMVAGPTTTTTSPSLGYGVALSNSSKAAQTVTLFLRAYLAGQGETEPYVSPHTSIPAITPVPYTAVEAVTYTSTAQPSDNPSDADTVGVLATVDAKNAVGQEITATYVVQLQARAGRWEVKSLESLPVLANSSGPATPTTTPVPTGGSK